MKEKIYIHKVRMNLENGWGISSGISIETLGHYKDKDKASEAKRNRDSEDIYMRYHDIGDSWIEEKELE